MEHLEEIGHVVETINGKAKIRIQRHASCAKCGACSMGNNLMVELELENTLGARTGQYVVVKLENASLLRAAVWVYILPLVMMILGYWLGENAARWWGAKNIEAFGLLIGFAALFLTFLGIKWADRHWINATRYLPRMTDFATPSETKDVLPDNP